MRPFFFAAAVVWCLWLGAVPGSAEEAKEERGPRTSRSEKTDIVVSGKLFYALERWVAMPFDATVMRLHVQPGERVKRGEPLVQFRLTPEAALNLRRRVSSFLVKDLEMRLAEIEKRLSELEEDLRETQVLAQQNMAPADRLTHLMREVDLLKKERANINERLPVERSLAEEDKAVVAELLGYPVRHGHVPGKGRLIAPIKGHVVWVDTDIREAAEIKAKRRVLRIGTMDPILIRARVHEIEAVQLKVGDRATFTTEAIPGRRFEARVSRISWATLTPALDQPSYYEVELEVPNPDLVLREGLRGKVKFRKAQ